MKTITDFLKANFGIFVLVFIFWGMMFLAMFVFTHNAYPSAGDFLTWLQGKIGEVLASIMTVIVGGATSGRRSSDPDRNQPPPPNSGADHP